MEEAISYLNLYSAIVVKSEVIEGKLTNIYAYSKDFTHSIYLENNKINLQICFNQGTITLGSPIILGDY